jgi:large subunit ribosomal protein L4
MKLKIYNSEGGSQGDMEIADDLLVSGSGDQAVHETVVAHLDACRARSARTLNKGEVAGSNKKPWRQKGTGRARAGYRSSPIWRGGGVVFGPREGHSTKKVTRKTRKLAFRRALSERLSDGSIKVLEELTLAETKTKALVSVLSGMEIEGGALLILDSPETWTAT